MYEETISSEKSCDNNYKIITDKYTNDISLALAALQDMQREFGYIPRDGLEALACHFDCHVAHLYSMATFYKALSLKPKGRHVIKVCDGTACHIRGSGLLIDAIKRQLGLDPGDVTEDGEYSLELVNCLGSCAIAPVMVIDDKYYGKVRPDRLKEIIEALGSGREDAHE